MGFHSERGTRTLRGLECRKALICAKKLKADHLAMRFCTRKRVIDAAYNLKSYKKS